MIKRFFLIFAGFLFFLFFRCNKGLQYGIFNEKVRFADLPSVVRDTLLNMKKVEVSYYVDDSLVSFFRKPNVIGLDGKYVTKVCMRGPWLDYTLVEDSLGNTVVEYYHNIKDPLVVDGDYVYWPDDYYFYYNRRIDTVMFNRYKYK